jgi:hypothetical protein
LKVAFREPGTRREVRVIRRRKLASPECNIYNLLRFHLGFILFPSQIRDVTMHLLVYVCI